MSKSSPVTVIDNCPFDEDSNVTISPSSGPTNPKASSTPSAGASSSSKTTPQLQETSKTTVAPAATIISSPLAASSAPTKATSRAPRRITAQRTRKIHAVITASAPGVQATSVGAAVTASDKAAQLGAKSSSITPSPSALPPPPAATIATSASGEAYVRCDSTSTWSLCGDGVCTFMGLVPTGTVCRDGRMVAERRRVKRQEAGVRMEIHRRAKSVVH